jgi:hypothetical protein
MSNPDPEPTALDKFLQAHKLSCASRKNDRVVGADITGYKYYSCNCGRDAALVELKLLRSDLAAVQAERDALVAENAKLLKERESVERQAKSILAVLHS